VNLLAIGIGNSNLHIGVFLKATLVANWRAHTNSDKTADEYAILFSDFFDQIGAHFGQGVREQGAILVSVVPPLTPTIQQLCRDRFGLDPLVVSTKLRTNMPIRYENPQALGADRLVDAIAAKDKYGAPVIIIDFGTATTFNAVNRAGEFCGGAIAPGVNLAAEALYQATAQLPLIDLAVPPNAIATNTVHSLQSGILFGYVGLVEGMVARLREELDEPHARVVATGGRATLIAPLTRHIDVVDSELILHGLRVIYDMNVHSLSS
jgi:type III pantothenate kinase